MQGYQKNNIHKDTHLHTYTHLNTHLTHANYLCSKLYIHCDLCKDNSGAGQRGTQGQDREVHRGRTERYTGAEQRGTQGRTERYTGQDIVVHTDQHVCPLSVTH